VIVKDLIERYPAEDIVNEVIDLCSVDDAEHDDIFQAHLELIQQIKAIQPVDTEHLILGYYYVDEGKEYLDTLLYRKADIRAFDPDSELSHIDSIAGLADDEIERLSHLHLLPESYAYELCPWSEILGYEICEDNAKEIGPTRLAAAVIYEMTFCGLTEAEVAAEREKLDESLTEAETIWQLPPEERDKHLYSADELFAELGIRDERTDEDKERAYRALCREVLENHLRIYKLLTECC
jgi:hypothetical protein